MSAPTIASVTTTPREGGMLLVQPVWTGVDRPVTGGWVVRDARMARRLEAALLAGAVYPAVEVGTDVAGQTYASGRALVMGKYMNADLRRLGF